MAAMKTSSTGQADVNKKHMPVEDSAKSTGSPRFRLDLRMNNNSAAHNARQPLSARNTSKHDNITAILPTDAMRKKHVSFHIRGRRGSKDSTPQKAVPDDDQENVTNNNDKLFLIQRQPLPGTSDVFRQALDTLDVDTDPLSDRNSPLPGDLHVKRSSLIATMTELQISSSKIDESDELDKGENDTFEEQTSPKSPVSPTLPKPDSNGHAKTQQRQQQQQKPPTPKKNIRVRKISAPSKLQNTPTSAWKSFNMNTPKNSPRQSPVQKRRSASVICPPKLSELDTSRYDERRPHHRSVGGTDSPMYSPRILSPNTSPPFQRRKIGSTIKDMQTVSKYIEHATSGAGRSPMIRPDVFRYSDTSQVLSPRQILVRRGIALEESGWLNDGLGDVTEISSFCDIKSYRHIRKSKDSRSNEV